MCCKFQKRYTLCRYSVHKHVHDLHVLPTDTVTKKYYFGYFKNWIGGHLSITIINSDLQPVNYLVEAPRISLYQTGIIKANDELIISFSNDVEVKSHHDQDKGLYLETSGNKIAVFGQNQLSATSDTFLISPVTSHCITEYTYYALSVVRSSSSYRNYYSSVLIVGIHNNTVMKLTVTQPVNVAVGDVTTSLTAGKQYSFVISRLQTVYVRSHEDLSGTKVVTDKAVSVFSGHECGRVPWNTGDCDYLIEQIPPTALWGTVYYIAPFATRTSYTITILAAYSITDVSISCENFKNFVVIKEGEFVTLTLEEHCAIHSNNEILVGQFSHAGGTGDPMMIILPATIHYADKFDVSTIRNPSRSDYIHYVNIIVMSQFYQPEMIYMIENGINKSLSVEKWIPIKVNNITEAYAVQVKVQKGTIKIIHNNSEALMSLTVYGFASIEGYGHSGSLSIFSNRSTG